MREAILLRKSRRTYPGKPVTCQEQDRINEIIAEINQESGLSIKFIEDGNSAFASAKKTYGLFPGVVSIIALKGKRRDADLSEKVGYYGERLVLDITDMGLGTCWVGGSFDRDKVESAEDERLIAVITLGQVHPSLSAREETVRKAIAVNHKEGRDMLVSDVAWDDIPSWLRNGMDAVALAPSTKNSQKTKFYYEKGKVIAKIAGDYGMDMVDLGIAKCHFEMEAGGSFDFGNGAEFERKDPA